MADIDTTIDTKAEAPDTAVLFRGFLILGLTGFGGVLPLARHMVVEQRRWLTGAEFIELLSLCQFLPGGNIVNLSVAIGLHFRGIPGALAALFGLIAAPTLIRTLPLPERRYVGDLSRTDAVLVALGLPAAEAEA